MASTKGFLAASLLAVAAAYTQPGSQTYGALLTPNTSDAVTTGESFSITWDNTAQSTDGVTVSLVLCKGPGSNCVLQPTAIVEGVPAAQASYNWAVPCSLTPGVQSTDTGYGMLIIVDGTGEFQYSTQFSVNAGSSCSSSSTTAVSSASSTSATAVSSSVSSTQASNSSSQSAESSVSSTVSSVTSSTPAETSITSHTSGNSTPAHSATSSTASSKMVTSTTTGAASTGTSNGSASASASSTGSFKGGATKLAGGALGIVAAGFAAALVL